MNSNAEASDLFFNADELVIPRGVPDQKTIFAYDIGGSLCKIAYAVPSLDNTSTKIRMVTFSNKNTDVAAEFIVTNVIAKGKNDAEVCAVGLGLGSRTCKTFNETLAVKIEMSDEFKMFAKGLSYMLKNLKEAEYVHPYIDPQLPTREEMGFPTFQTKQTEVVTNVTKSKDGHFPVMLGFCGSGLGYMVVYEDGEYELVGGSMKAGLFYYALGSLLTGANSYEELSKLAEAGDATVVNTSMGDFEGVEYGGFDSEKLKKTFAFETFAFGNLIRNNIHNPHKEDLARALLHTVCEEINLCSGLIARQFGLDKVFMAGTFLRNNDIAKKYLERTPFTAMLYGKPIFLRYLKFEPYIGVVGAVISKIFKDN